LIAESQLALLHLWQAAVVLASQLGCLTACQLGCQLACMFVCLPDYSAAGLFYRQQKLQADYAFLKLYFLQGDRLTLPSGSA
jgi:hypothetical protein